MHSKPFDSASCAVQLRAAVVHLARQLRVGMQHDGLPAATLSALSQLYRGGSMTPTELARREGVKLQTLTRMLAELEASGWIVRSLSAADARQTLLTISQQGKKRLAAAAKGADVPLAKAIEMRLSADDQVVLLRACALIASLCDAMQSQGDAP